jgi:hypothetical protein
MNPPRSDIGNKERAMTLLDEVVAKRSNCLIFVRNDPPGYPADYRFHSC